MSKRNSRQRKDTRRGRTTPTRRDHPATTELLLPEMPAVTGVAQAGTENREGRPGYAADYISVALTDDSQLECVAIQFGNRVEYLHATTALYLRNRLTKSLEEFDAKSKDLGGAGLCRQDESEDEFFKRKHAEVEQLNKILTRNGRKQIRYIPLDTIPDDLKLLQLTDRRED